MERTLAIIKPDAVEAKVAGRILTRIEQEGFRIADLRLLRMTREQAEGFYAVHRARPFFRDLTSFMSSGPCMVMVLEADDVIERWRALIGPTDPGQAPPGTLREQFGTNVERNALHGSDGAETARTEIDYFFF